MNRPLVVNQPVDDFITLLDHARQRLHLTKGEMTVFASMALAGILEDLDDREALTTSIGFILAYVSKNADALVQFDRLKRTCAIDPDRVAQNPTEMEQGAPES